MFYFFYSVYNAVADVLRVGFDGLHASTTSILYFDNETVKVKKENRP